MKTVLGIDLGTTNTVVAVLRDSGPEILLNAEGDALIPSVVAIDGRNVLLVGATALAYAARNPDSGARFFKRDMGSDVRRLVGTRSLTPIELSAMVLREACAVADAALGERVRDAVVTVPAWFGEGQRAATREAAELAGLTLLRMVNEPTAAAIAYGALAPNRERRVCVVDLGGGTLDVTLLDIFEGVFEVVGTGGNGRLGGEDFTDALWFWACKEAGIDHEAPSPVASLLREECEVAKRRLAQADFVSLEIPEARTDGWRTACRTRVRRAAFEALVAPLTEAVVACVRDTLSAAGRTSANIDEVVLAGGATRMPAVRAALRRVLGRDAVVGPDPDLAVAMGAALQAGLVIDHVAAKEIVVTDVLGRSVGVEVVRQANERVHDGYFLPILHRNSTLPTRRVERVFTLHAQQKVVRVKVYEGEHRYVRENRLIGEVEVRDIPPATHPDGNQAVDLSFAHDISGILDVEATIVSTGAKVGLVIERHSGRLTPAEKAKALAVIYQLKTDPRALLPNRLLLELALNVHARVHPENRTLLDAALFRFEDALARQDLPAVATAAEVLRGTLSHPSLRPEAE